MASNIEWMSMHHAFGPLWHDVRISRWVVESLEGPRSSYVDFEQMLGDSEFFRTATQTETQVTLLAAMLYRGGSSFNLGLLMDTADPATWQRCIEAIVMKRGLEDEIPAGQIVESWPHG